MKAPIGIARALSSGCMQSSGAQGRLRGAPHSDQSAGAGSQATSGAGCIDDATVPTLSAKAESHEDRCDTRSVSDRGGLLGCRPRRHAAAQCAHRLVGRGRRLGVRVDRGDRAHAPDAVKARRALRDPRGQHDRARRCGAGVRRHGTDARGGHALLPRSLRDGLRALQLRHGRERLRRVRCLSHGAAQCRLVCRPGTRPIRNPRSISTRMAPRSARR